MEIIEITDISNLNKALTNNSGLKLFYFYAEDAPECSQMSDVLQELVQNDNNKNVHFFKVNATIEELSRKFDVSSVPAFIFYTNKEVARLIGADVPALVSRLNELAQQFGSTEEDLNSRIRKLINKAPIMLFMKGSPDMPKCGFSHEVVELLSHHNAKYETFDILEDWDVREGLKKYSNWPTYPQLYINGELVGGIDILKELSKTGELDELLSSTQSSFEDKLKQLINQAKVMIFMKGTPEQPRCGFSKTLIGIMNQTGVEYETFDILEDQAVREGLKKYSNWPTYPQIYVKGNLIGGLDIIKELHENGELKAALEVE